MSEEVLVLLVVLGLLLDMVLAPLIVLGIFEGVDRYLTWRRERWTESHPAEMASLDAALRQFWVESDANGTHDKLKGSSDAE